MPLELYYHRDREPNFGDDLNAELWPAVLPAEMLDADDVVLIGVGSILTEGRAGSRRAPGKRVVVLGSGTSYGQPPLDTEAWIVKSVRGPLTARAIGRQDAAVTDGAILLAASGLAPQAEGRDVVFIPHHRSLRDSRWSRVCELAGIRFQSPAAPLASVLSAIAGARLVIAEALHGAIVADTLRKPWLPVSLSPGFDRFKWLDWCLSMEVPLEPTALPPSCAAEAARNADLVRRNPYLASPARRLHGDEAVHELLAHLQAMYGQAPGRAPSLPVRALRRSLRILDTSKAERAAAELATLTQRPGYLSAERVFRDRLERTLARVDSLRALV